MAPCTFVDPLLISPYQTPAHCHPTDDPRPWQDIGVLTEKLRNAAIGRVCAMATSTRDQHYVAQLASHLPGKVVPAFGYHPWFVHTVTGKGTEEAHDHYRKLFSSSTSREEEVEELARQLPTPLKLDELLSSLQQNLEAHPDALLGEVGLDRVFRLPRDPRGYTREPDKDDKGESTPPNGGISLGRRERPLTSLSTPIEHQVYIARAQIELAIRLKRSVSFHCVRAGGAVISLFDDIQKAYPRKGMHLSRRQQKLLAKEARQVGAQAPEGDESEGDSSVRPCFDDINIDLHSCTLSPQLISQLQRKHPNVYVSFSLAINARQKDLADQLRASDPVRLLIESDWHSAEGLGARCWTMLRLAVDTIGPDFPLPKSDQGGERSSGAVGGDEARYAAAAHFFEGNWRRFVGSEKCQK